MFRHTKIFFNNNTETEYTSCGTYLCLLFHIVAFDIKALVVHCHQFVYALFKSSGRREHSSGFHHMRSVCHQGAPSFFGNRKKSDGARSGLYGGCSKIYQWNCSAGLHADVHCRATEQFHARACLFGNII